MLLRQPQQQLPLTFVCVCVCARARAQKKKVGEKDRGRGVKIGEVFSGIVKIPLEKDLQFCVPLFELDS
jgi:hypothetical protein